MKPELLSYLQEKAKQPFDEVTNHCVHFTNDCWTIYHGFPYSPEFNTMTKIEDSSFADPLEGFDSILERSEKPQEGCLVAMKVKGDTNLAGLVLGFCVGDLSVFLNTKGMKYIPTKFVDYSWKNKDDKI